ncbi:MAG: glutaredoxin 3 [Pseudomonadota bacterium]
MAQVEMYTTRFCGFCAAAKRLLKAKGVSYTEIDVSGSQEKRAQMMQRANGRHTVPQIFIGDTHVGGFDDMYALEQAGKLDALLAA